MSDLLVIVLDDEQTARDLRDEIARLGADYAVDLEDIELVTRDAEGRVRFGKQARIAGLHALGGGVWGLVLGAAFLVPVAGAAVGTLAGAVAGALRDVGLDDAFVEEIGRTLVPGSAAVCVLVRKVSAESLLERMERFRGKGHVITTPLSEVDEGRLRRIIESDETLRDIAARPTLR
ncbi:MAG: DUF1269 domain-containing protein [Paracoccaceae bacterium]